jgi:hypothetical protein
LKYHLSRAGWPFTLALFCSGGYACLKVHNVVHGRVAIFDVALSNICIRSRKSLPGEFEAGESASGYVDLKGRFL